MKIVETDVIAPVDADSIEISAIDTLLAITAETGWAAERERYLHAGNDFLFPFRMLHLNPPSGDPALPPDRQDDKTDFVKQNVREFTLGDTFFVRGWVHVGNDAVRPFLKISYRGGPDSGLAAAGPLAAEITLELALLGRSDRITVPYNRQTHRYDVELWGIARRDADGPFGPQADAAINAGMIQFHPDLIRGNDHAFRRDVVAGAKVWDVEPDHLLHPLRPLRIAYCWSAGAARDPAHDMQVCMFNSIVRGWDRFQAAGTSIATHGGSGALRYSNLLSNDEGILSRHLEPWMFDGFGRKGSTDSEPFFAVHYIDMHVVDPHASVGIHRHRDNQEIMFVLSGAGAMVSGDWCQYPNRERAFQVQTLRQGHMAMVKSGGLHGFKNTSDDPVHLLMFGGYD